MNDNIAIGIMTSYKLRERFMACKNTWTKDFDNVYFFGGDVHDENLIRLEGVGEDHSSSFFKQQYGLKYMFEKNNEYDWFSMNGCDHIIFKNRIMEALKVFDRNEDLLFSEVYRTMNIDGLETTIFAGGASFFMSNSLMKKVYQVIDEFNEHWISISQPVIPDSNVSIAWADVSVAYIVKKYFNIDPIHMPGMFSQHPTHYQSQSNFNGINSFENLKSPLSFHYIRPDEMEKIWKQYGK
jgi:hypothetical protein